MSVLPQKYITDSQKQHVQVIEATTERTLQKQQVHVTHERTETTTTTTTTTSTTKTCVQLLDDPNTTILLTEDPPELPARDYMESKPLQTQMCMQMISTWNQCKKGKGTSWSEYEHRLFLEGLKIYGKGNWKSISKYVKSRSPTQVASHAQKYFIRQNASAEQKRRKSILDITLDTLDKRRDST